jgi:hypothetical protein
MSPVSSRHQPKKPWRMTAIFNNGESKTIAYASEGAARSAANFERSCGALDTKVWKKEDEWNEG